MDTVVFLNIFNFLLILSCIIKRYRTNKLLQLNDFVLIFLALFFPLGLIRLYLGFNSVIEYDIFYHYELLEKTSWLVSVFLLCYLIGMYFANSFFNLVLKRSSKKVKKYSLQYLKVFNKLTYFFSILTLFAMIVFIKSQGSLSNYFANIESLRQTMTGQMGNFTIIYCNTLITLYNILINKKFVLSSKIGILISILFFMLYGYRGPIIGIIIITFFVLQKLNIFHLKVNIKNIFIGSLIVGLFVISQDLRSIKSTEPFFVKLLTRFSGIEPVMVIYDKVVHKDMFTFYTFLDNIRAFIELPIPRIMIDDKMPPVSILLADKLFYDIGKRNFSTGGISPTIIGSLIWNFHYLGLFVMIIYSFVVIYIEKKISIENDSANLLFLISISLYLILSVEYPENFLGVLWMLMIGNFIIFIFNKFLANHGIH